MSYGEYLFLLNAKSSSRPRSARDRYVLNLEGGRQGSSLLGQTGRKAGWGSLVPARGWWRVRPGSNSDCLQKNREADKCWDDLSPPCPRPIRSRHRFQVESKTCQ